MSQRHPACLVCGFVGKDIAMGLVEVANPERIVEVRVPVNHRDGSIEIALEVPERFYAVPCCRDRDACRLRELTQMPLPPVEPTPEPVGAAVEDEEDAWLRI